MGAWICNMMGKKQIGSEVITQCHGVFIVANSEQEAKAKLDIYAAENYEPEGFKVVGKNVGPIPDELLRTAIEK